MSARDASRASGTSAGNMDPKAVLTHLRTLSNPVDVAGMARFGINPARTFGIRIPVLRALAKDIGTNHELALALWHSGYHEARILASMVDDPDRVTKAQAERWGKDFDPWDMCDQCCMNLFKHTPWAWDKAKVWSGRRAEFVKRAGFVMMACLAVADKGVRDEAFTRFFPLIRREATDGRNFAKKAVNPTLRRTGKRNRRLDACPTAPVSAFMFPLTAMVLADCREEQKELVIPASAGIQTNALVGKAVNPTLRRLDACPTAPVSAFMFPLTAMVLADCRGEQKELVIPAEAGIQTNALVGKAVNPTLRRTSKRNRRLLKSR